MEKICENCMFFNVNKIDSGLTTEYEFECRRYAPRILHGCGEGWSNQKFPNVKHHDWCGEFKINPEPHNKSLESTGTTGDSA